MAHDDFGFEPVRGLPETPPAGEQILWQGAPDTVALTRQALAADWVAGYFVLLALWRGVAIGAADGLYAGLVTASWYAVMGLVAVAVLALIGRILARATVYTLTSRRVVMRIGAALRISLNLPYRWIEAADLSVGRDGTGTIALTLKGETRFAYLVLWPHVQPWTLARPRPALRCIRDPRAVAAILARAAAAQVSEVRPEPGLAAAAVAAE